MLWLAWALRESGRAEEAKPLLAVHPIVQPGQEPLLHSLIIRGTGYSTPKLRCGLSPSGR